MKNYNNIQEQESPMDIISVKNDFGIEDELYDNFAEYDTESNMEEDVCEKLDTSKIDVLVSDEDYLGLEEYLQKLDEEDRIEANEYIENNFPEFLKDEEGSTFEPMKWKATANEDLADTLNKKTSFARNTKQDLGKDLSEYYRNAA